MAWGQSFTSRQVTVTPAQRARVQQLMAVVDTAFSHDAHDAEYNALYEVYRWVGENVLDYTYGKQGPARDLEGEERARRNMIIADIEDCSARDHHYEDELLVHTYNGVACSSQPYIKRKVFRGSPRTS